MWRSDDRRPRILYLSRDGILDGLGESQILGYVSALASDHRFWLITFEKSIDRAGSLRESLSAQGIEWRPLRFYGRSTPFLAALGLGRFLFLALGLVLKNRIRIIHARSYVPCLVAVLVRLFSFGYPRVLFDMRGFWVDERAEAGGWKRETAIYRIGKRIEKLLLKRSAEIITLTGAARDEVTRLLGGGGAGGAAISVIPTCVDTERFRPLHGAGAPGSIASEWRDRLVFVYTGAAGYWQHPGSLVEFFSAVRQERADAAFLCLLRTGGEKMRRALVAAGLTEVSRVEEAVPLGGVPRWLSLGAVGVVWYRPTFSRIGNFPTKLGEYLASGLPVIVGGATADSVEIVTRERVGAVVREFTGEAYREALGQVLALLKDPDIVSRCRRVAERELSLRVGAERYREIYGRLSERAG